MRLIGYFLGNRQQPPKWFDYVPEFLDAFYDLESNCWHWVGIKFQSDESISIPGDTLFSYWKRKRELKKQKALSTK